MADIEITDFAVDGYRGAGSTAYLQIVSESAWVDVDGDDHAALSYEEIPLVVNTVTHRIDETTFDLTPTQDARVNQQATYRFQVVDANRKNPLILASGVSVPYSTPVMAWASLRLLAQSQSPWRDVTSPTTTDMVNYVQSQIAAVAMPDASDTVKGKWYKSLVEAVTTAALPAAGIAGRLRRVADGLRGAVLDTGSRWINLLMGNVSIEEFASLAAMISDIGSTERTVFVPASYAVAASATIPANITLKFTGSGKLDVASGQTVTLEGAVSAPARQVFTGSGSVVFTGNRRTSDFDPLWWGAVGDGITDSTAAFQAAAAARNATGGRLLIRPTAGGFLVGGAAVANQILSMTAPGEIVGWGPRSVLLVKSDTPATTDIIRITPPPHVGNAEAGLNSPEDNSGYATQYFAIRPQAGTPGRDGIRVDITTSGSFFQNSYIRGLYIGDLGGHSISLINTTVLAPTGVNADGIFNNHIIENIFHGGIFADALGDSNHINRNRFWSITDAVHRALDITFITGAGCNEFVGNNITVKLGAKFGGGTGTIFSHNYVEPFRAGSAGADGACVSFDGGAASPRITGNRFVGSINNNLNGLYLGLVSGAAVDGNRFGVDTGAYGVDVSASATDTTVTSSNAKDGLGSLIRDLGTGTTTEVFSTSGGRVTRVGTAFGSTLGATEAFSGFGALNTATLEVNQNSAVSADTNFAALVLAALQSGLTNLVGAIYFVNGALGAAEKRIAGITGSTDGATNSGRLDFATFSASVRTVKLGIGKNGVDFLRLSPLTPAQITADQNNYNPGSASPLQRWSSDASRNVTGLAVSQADGLTIRVWNVGSQNLVLMHENAASAAANRFTCSTGADITLGANRCAVFDYDGTTQRWRVTLLP